MHETMAICGQFVNAYEADWDFHMVVFIWRCECQSTIMNTTLVQYHGYLISSGYPHLPGMLRNLSMHVLQFNFVFGSILF